MARRPVVRVGETVEQAERRAKRLLKAKRKRDRELRDEGTGGRALESINPAVKSPVRAKPARIRLSHANEASREAIWGRILDEIRNRRFIGTACALAGVSSEALRSWLDKGRLGIEPFDRFLREFQRADAEAQSSVLDELLAEDDPGERSKNLRWMAERRWRRDLGEVIRVEVQATDQLPKILTAIRGACDDQTFDRICQAIEALAGLPATGPGTGVIGCLGDGSSSSADIVPATGETVD